MTASWVPRPYRPGDEDAILLLHSLVFHEEQTRQYWDWLRRRNPAGPAWMWLAWDRDQLVGHYAVIPERLLVNGIPVLGAQSLDTMTHPAYLRRGIFAELARRTYEEAEAHGVAITYGLPNEQSRPGLVRRLGWRDVFPLRRFVKILKPKAVVEGRLAATYLSLVSGRGDSRLKSVQRRSSGWEVEEINRLPDDYDTFSRRVASSHRITVQRDSSYLRWRYLEHPHTAYHVMAARYRGELVGSAAMTVLRAEGRNEGFITCLESMPKQEGTVEHLILGLLGICQAQDVARLTYFMHRASLVESLRRSGFLERSSPLSIAVRAPRPETVAADPFAADNWALEVGDTDYI